MSNEALGLWATAAAWALYMAYCVARGRLRGRFGTLIERGQNPGQFWVMIGILGVGLFVIVFAALYFTLPALPDHPV